MRLLAAVAVAIAAALLLLRACFHFSYEETPYKEVYIRQVGSESFELAFRYQAKVSGNVHGPSIPFSSSTHDGIKWFYVKRATGDIPAAQVVSTDYRACKDPLYWQQAMRGRIALSEEAVIFALQMPRYDKPDGTTTNTVQRYENWEHNGQYSIVRGEPPLPKSLPSDYRPSACDIPKPIR